MIQINSIHKYRTLTRPPRLFLLILLNSTIIEFLWHNKYVGKIFSQKIFVGDNRVNDYQNDHYFQR